MCLHFEMQEVKCVWVFEVKKEVATFALRYQCFKVENKACLQKYT